MADRQAFHYPPYYRLLRITLRHTDKSLLDKAAAELATSLRTETRDKGKAETRTRDNVTTKALTKENIKAGKQSVLYPEILGPQSPLVGKVQQMHLMIILVKLPRTPDITKFKEIIGEVIDTTRSDKRFGKLSIIPDVDPY